MDESINLVYSIFNSVIDLLFNKLLIIDGVSLGYVIISIIIILVLVKSILNQVTIGSNVSKIKRGLNDE